MSQIKSRLSYADIVSKSRDLTRTLGKLDLSEDINVAGALEIPLKGGDVSIWSVYEVVVAIHCLTNDENPRFRNFLKVVKANLLFGYFKLKRKFKREQFNNVLPNADQNIFFLGFTEYLAVENFESIFEKMTNERKYHPILLTDVPHEGGLADFSNMDINSFDHDFIQSRSDSIGKVLKLKLAEARVLIGISDLSPGHKYSLGKALAFISRLISKDTIQKYLSAAEWLLNHHRPSAIVSVDVADPRARVFCLLANKLGIPVVQLQAGAINQECIEWSFCNDDLMLCHGPKIENELKKLDFDTRNVICTGSAKFERLSIRSAKQQMSLSSRFSVPDNKITVLLLTSYTGLFDTSSELREQHQIYNNAYHDIISETILCDNVALIIKPHPLENPRIHKNIAAKYDNIFVAESRENTSDLIGSTDAVISFGSTATFDAVILNKVVIVMNFDGFALNPMFVDSSFCFLPKNRSELSTAFSYLNKGDLDTLSSRYTVGREEFLRDINFFKSSPSETITKAIGELIEFKESQLSNI